MLLISSLNGLHIPVHVSQDMLLISSLNGLHIPVYVSQDMLLISSLNGLHIPVYVSQDMLLISSLNGLHIPVSILRWISKKSTSIMFTLTTLLNFHHLNICEAFPNFYLKNAASCP